ncbi:MAG: ribbon-helix-helix domain-containing protein [Cyanophyceae cyanobacterium]
MSVPPAMSSISGKRRVTVTIDAGLIDAIDQVSDNRSAVIEAALRLWRATQIETQMAQFYQNRPADDSQAEVEWAQETQEQAMQTWAEDPTPSSSR